jgi:hypothetical protein
VVDTVARNYFRYAILKQRRRVPGTKSGLSEPGCNGRLQIRRDIPPNHRNFLNRNRSKMIRIERGAEVGPGIYEYRVWGTPIFGKSRQPLLDACRQIKAMGGPTKHQRAGVFRKGSTVADISCSVEVGALLTVSEPDKARARFVKYQDFEWAAQSAQRAA